MHEQLEKGELADAESNVYRIFGDLQTMDEEVARSINGKPQLGKGPCRHALLVDDNKNENTLLAGFLRCRDFEVTTAGDGADAMHFLSHNETPDFVLLDMQMPKFDGRWTIEEIRKNPRFEDLKVFAVSGIHPGEYGVEIGGGGIDHWFRKPIDPEKLVFQLKVFTTETPSTISL